jgi:hypothetical protein
LIFIAAEEMDVFLDPSERELLIEEPGIQISLFINF